MYLFIKRRFYNIKNNKSKLLSIVIVFIVFLFSVLLITFSEHLPFYFPNWNDILSFNKNDNILLNYKNYVSFINVGQGDATFIKSNDKNILIDGGDNTQESNILNYLKNVGVKKLDLVIVSHPHADHIGTLDKVIDYFRYYNDA